MLAIIGPPAQDPPRVIYRSGTHAKQSATLADFAAWAVADVTPPSIVRLAPLAGRRPPRAW